MCGVLFTFNPELEAQELERKCRESSARIMHRGPDDNGLEVQSPWAVGHRRLAILDLAGSRQPMCDPTARYWLSYNGELYNFRDLRTALEPNWTFRHRGDTEVVLAGLIHEGESFLRRMEGMWALALWDRESATLLLARDRMGKKPLYYQHARRAFACASELRALRSLAVAKWQEDPDSTADYFRFGYPLPGTTAYAGVREVLPGHVLRWHPDQGVKEQSYWRLVTGGYSGTLAQAASQMREKLIQAVKRRLVSDVEVGAFLSGGVDSSLVVGILGKELNVHPKTFTIGFTESSFDERPYAQRVAEHFGTDHFERVLERWSSETLIRLMLDHVGQPFADSSLLATAEVSAVAAEQVKVSMSGDGGDELFSGYQRYQARVLLRWYTRLPRQLRGNVDKLIRALPEPMAHHSGSLLKKAHLFLDAAARETESRSYTAPPIYPETELAQLLPDLAPRGHTPPGLPQECRLDHVTEMMTMDALVYLPQDILVKVDRASMAHSLEARAPFLDREVVELAFALPRRWHRRGLRGKRLLGQAFPSLLPSWLWRRRKQGFSVPVHAWFRKELGDKLLTLIQGYDSPLNGPHVEKMLHDHRHGRRDHGMRLWGIYAYLIWRAHD